MFVGVLAAVLWPRSGTPEARAVAVAAVGRAVMWKGVAPDLSGHISKTTVGVVNLAGAVQEIRPSLTSNVLAQALPMRESPTPVPIALSITV